MYRKRYRGRKRKRYFRKGYDRVGGFYGRNRKRRKFGLGRPEKKFFDEQINVTEIAQGGAFINTNTVPTTNTSTIVDIGQGVSESQRIGRKCTITNIHMKLNFRWKTDSATTMTETGQLPSEVVRMIIFWDKQCNGTAITATQLLETDDYNAFRQLANKMRFRVL